MSIAGSLNPCVGGADLSYGRGVVTHRFSTLFSIVSMKENEKTHFKMVDWSGAIVTPRGFSGTSDAPLNAGGTEINPSSCQNVSFRRRYYFFNII